MSSLDKWLDRNLNTNTYRHTHTEVYSTLVSCPVCKIGRLVLKNQQGNVLQDKGCKECINLLADWTYIYREMDFLVGDDTPEFDWGNMQSAPVDEDLFTARSIIVHRPCGPKIPDPQATRYHTQDFLYVKIPRHHFSLLAITNDGEGLKVNPKAFNMEFPSKIHNHINPNQK